MSARTQTTPGQTNEPQQGRRGFDIGLVGMDGIGKSTLASALCELLGAHGQVERVSWESSIREHPSRFAVDGLKELGLSAYRTMYGAAHAPDLDLAATFPSTWDEFVATGYEANLSGLRVTSNDPRGIVNSAFVETAGNLFLRMHVVEPRLAEGTIVVQESYGVKHVVRALVMARWQMREQWDDASVNAVDAIMPALTRAFRCWAAPRVPVLVTGAPELAASWRAQQQDYVGVAEDLSTIGHEAAGSYVEFQRECAAAYEELAAAEGWLVVRMRDRSVEENIGEALETIAVNLRDNELLPSV